MSRLCESTDQSCTRKPSICVRSYTQEHPFLSGFRACAVWPGPVGGRPPVASPGRPGGGLTYQRLSDKSRRTESVVSSPLARGIAPASASGRARRGARADAAYPPY